MTLVVHAAWSEIRILMQKNTLAYIGVLCSCDPFAFRTHLVRCIHSFVLQLSAWLSSTSEENGKKKPCGGVSRVSQLAAQLALHRTRCRLPFQMLHLQPFTIEPCPQSHPAVVTATCFERFQFLLLFYWCRNST